MWGINVFAGLGQWDNLNDRNNGMYVVMEKGGREYLTNKMPDAIQHSVLRAGWRNLF